MCVLREPFGSLLIAWETATDVGYYLPSRQLGKADRLVLISDAWFSFCDARAALPRSTVTGSLTGCIQAGCERSHLEV